MLSINSTQFVFRVFMINFLFTVLIITADNLQIRKSEESLKINQVKTNNTIEVNIYESKTLELVCDNENENGNVKIVKWSRNGNGVVSCINKTICQIRNVTKENAGIYDCDVKINNYIHKKIFNVTVLYKPRLSLTKNDYTENGHLIAVTVDSNSKFTLKWIFNGSEIVNNDVYSMDSSKVNNALLVRKLRKAVIGLYTCIAYNDVGITRITVNVNSPPPNFVSLEYISHLNRSNEIDIIFVLKVESVLPVVNYTIISLNEVIPKRKFSEKEFINGTLSSVDQEKVSDFDDKIHYKKQILLIDLNPIHKHCYAVDVTNEAGQTKQSTLMSCLDPSKNDVQLHVRFPQSYTD